MRTLVYALFNWEPGATEKNQTTGRTMWVYVGTNAFCCYVDEQPPVHALPPKPRSAA